MPRYIASRLLQGLALVLAVVILNFVLVHAAPGDPVETIAGASGGMSPELMAQLRTQYGTRLYAPATQPLQLVKAPQRAPNDGESDPLLDYLFGGDG